MPNKKKLESKSGSALILTTILLFVILGMVVSLTYVTVMEQKMSGKTKSSVGSFYNAESGVEWILNKIASSSESDIDGTFGTQWDEENSVVNCPASFGEDYCKVYLLDQNGEVIQDSSVQLSDVRAVRSVGSQGGETQRAIEAAVGAAGGGGCYVDYGLSEGSSVGSACTVSGFTVKGSAGTWGYCDLNRAGWPTDYLRSFRPPASSCAGSWSSGDLGEAYVCCI